MLTPPVAHASAQRGAGLVEFMVAIALGMLIIAGSLALYAGSFGNNAATLRVARLNNDLRAIMNAVTRDLRRAGFSGAASGGFSNPFQGITLTANPTVVLFSYDLDGNGTQGANEQFGFRHANSNTVQMTTNGGTNWESVSDPDRVTISRFDIEEESPGSISMGSTTVVSVQSRRYVITLVGSVTSGGQTFTRVLQESVRVRNEEVL